MAELYVQAIAIEREAAGRYRELADVMAAQGDHAVAALFRMLAEHEGRHLAALRRKARGIELPPLESDYSWPETLPADAVEQPLTPRAALAMALAAEKRAHAFFENAGRVCADAQTRALAREMAAEEAEHSTLIERMMQRGPQQADWRSSSS
jgi:rubrerythrin